MFTFRIAATIIFEVNDVSANEIRPFERLQITYWAGDFPPTLLDDFNSAATKHDKGKRPGRLYLGYHGHRCVFCGGVPLYFFVLSAPTELSSRQMA